MSTPAPPPSAPLRSTLLSLGLDAVLIIVFAAIGRASHHEDPIAGLFTTAWPFLVGLALGWLISLAWRRPMAIGRTGVPVWLITVAAGMALRVLADQGTQPAFIIVATIVIGVFLLGWRAVAALVTRARRH
ncbi:DUF3054 domain-containing protein [Microbacterium gorillae]|uniref:DUF3054 domain-containing protein n=1 Tax=Microbacterium gorillae TaxID=1231063 RepID=UPI000AB943D1|nr:DUF3054 domain-containing protein [Microbacterium gorillae]